MKFLANVRAPVRTVYFALVRHISDAVGALAADIRLPEGVEVALGTAVAERLAVVT